jgi:hypothetical protein
MPVSTTVDYTDLFTKIGGFIKMSNEFLDIQDPQLLGDDQGIDGILDNYEDRRDLVTGAQESYENYALNTEGWISENNDFIIRTLTDTQLALNTPTDDIDQVIDYIIEDMIDKNIVVVGNNVTGVVTDGDNIGNGSLFVSVLNVDDELDERPKTQIMKVLCESDQHTGATEGFEDFSITGWPIENPEANKAQGDGTTSDFTTLQTNTAIVNGDFEAWTNDEPDSWTINTGTNPLVNESSVAYIGDSSMELVGDGVSDIEVGQSIIDTFAVDSVYGAAVHVVPNVSAGGTILTLLIRGTDIDDIVIASADPFDLAQETSDPTWTAIGGFFVMPKDPPDDVEFVIEWSGTPALGDTILVDNLASALATTFGNVNYALTRGDIAFIRDDEFEVEITNDFAGIFQTYFGRFFDKMLPSDQSLGSDEAGTEGGQTVIDDSLAQ